MAAQVTCVEYYYANVRDELGAAYRVLSELAELGVHLLAFTAVPTGPARAQFALFPRDPSKLVVEARAAGIGLEGPHHAFLVQSDDELDALAGIHERLLHAGVDIYASSGVADGRGSFGYVVYVREDRIEDAAKALDCELAGTAVWAGAGAAESSPSVSSSQRVLRDGGAQRGGRHLVTDAAIGERVRRAPAGQQTFPREVSNP
jgi:hypothetical protein